MLENKNTVVHPRALRAVKLNGRAVDEDALQSVQMLTLVYLLVLTLGVLLIGLPPTATPYPTLFPYTTLFRSYRFCIRLNSITFIYPLSCPLSLLGALPI